MTAWPKWIRAGQVLKLTGWKRQYLDKLRQEGAVRTMKPYRKAWTWYDENQILELLNGKEKPNS